MCRSLSQATLIVFILFCFTPIASAQLAEEDCEAAVTFPDCEICELLCSCSPVPAGKLVDISASGTTLGDVLKKLAAKLDVNIVASDHLDTLVFFHLKGIAWDRGLEYLLRPLGLEMKLEYGVIRIATKEFFRQEREELRKALMANEEKEESK